MFCNNCGNQLDKNDLFCNNCGQKVENFKHKNSATKIVVAIIIFLMVIIIGLIIAFFTTSVVADDIISNDIFSYDDTQEIKVKGEDTVQKENATKNNIYRTEIVYDATYSNCDISTKQKATELIQKDAEIQREKYDNDSVKEIEKRIEEKYDILGVNLGEISVDMAKEIENVISTVYSEFPQISGKLTNLTLVNGNIEFNPIALFSSGFIFATSNSSNTYPWANKTFIALNTTYFFNEERLSASIADAVKAGHFPKNATIYSPVAHEFGHYISFLCMMNNHSMSESLLIDSTNLSTYYDVMLDFKVGDFSHKMIKEAYENYKINNPETTYTELDFRSSISSYAVAKDNEGEYIYDETIAEAFHDYYLNGENAAKASLEIMKILKKYIGGGANNEEINYNNNITNN